jgi:glycosyltransferase involved in cell wall biosynthesis
MKIAYIATGAAGMYCGTCLHDNTLAAALIKKGHKVALIPTYTPIRTDEKDVSIDHMFYGGINVYLQQKSALFRHTPWILDRMLDRPQLLNWLSRLSSSTDAKDLGSLTVSVLKGEEGNQNKELQKLVSWLRESYQPDLIQFNNCMFVGFAREIKKQMKIPVLCALTGEDIFLDGLIEPYKSEALRVLRERSRDVDGFVAVSQYYMEFMSKYLQVPQEKIHLARLGINLEGHGKVERPEHQDVFTIGYLARICPEKGLHLLVDAFHKLTQRLGTGGLRLRVAGYLGKRDQAYFEEVTRQIHEWDLGRHYDFLGEVDRKQKIEFLNSLSVLSVPTTYQEPKGLFVLEALANGIPVVEPRHGSFPEILEATGGGILVDPADPSALADGLEKLVRKQKLAYELGQQGKKAVHLAYSDDAMADATLQIYRKYLGE